MPAECILLKVIDNIVPPFIRRHVDQFMQRYSGFMRMAVLIGLPCINSYTGIEKQHIMIFKQVLFTRDKYFTPAGCIGRSAVNEKRTITSQLKCHLP